MKLEKKDLYPFDTVKRWLRGAIRSWTMWLNGITGTAAGMLSYLLSNPDWMLTLQPYITPKTYLALLIVNAVGNAYLRGVVTKQSIMEKGK